MALQRSLCVETARSELGGQYVIRRVLFQRQLLILLLFYWRLRHGFLGARAPARKRENVLYPRRLRLIAVTQRSEYSTTSDHRHNIEIDCEFNSIDFGAV